MNHKKNKLEVEKSRRNLLAAAGAGLAMMTTGSLLSAKSAQGDNILSNRKILTVYYSRSNNTRSLANSIHTHIGGDIEEILPIPAYSDNYDLAVNEVRLELLTGSRRQIEPLRNNISLYDTIFIGSPRWWGTLSVPVINFLLNNDLQGKTLLPFNTHAGGEREKTFDDLKLLCPHSTITEGLSVDSSDLSNAQNIISAWLQRSEIL